VTLQQSHQQVGYGSIVRHQNQLKPLRVQLRRKTTKRCQDCSAILVKPDGKAGSAHFIEKSMAWDVLPNLVLIQPLPSLGTGKESEFCVEITNPTLGTMSLEFSIKSKYLRNCQTLMKTNAIQLGPYRDLCEIQEIEEPNHQSILKLAVIPNDLVFDMTVSKI
jgi:hypothetical protein